LSDFAGKPVILNFWASWCAPCAVEFPQILKLAGQRKDAIFLFVSTDDSVSAASQFLKKYNLKIPGNAVVLIDEDKKVSQELYQTYKVPETYLISAKGSIRNKIIGADIDWLGPDVQQKLNDLR